MNRIITSIDLALEELSRGHLVAIPTETVYGLAADASNSVAVRAVFKTKSRPIHHPLIMHIGYDWDISKWVSEVPDYAKKLMEIYWPGPLTLIFNLKASGLISDSVTGGQDTIAIRCPDHPLALELLKKFNKPLVAPSANPFGKISPTNAQHVLQDFPNESFYILDGGRCKIGIESTIIQATENEHFQVLREGLINVNHLKEFKNNITQDKGTKMIKVPGSYKNHYQPNKPAFHVQDVNTIYSMPAYLTNCFILHFSNIREFDITG